jgi:hypothetical protein
MYMEMTPELEQRGELRLRLLMTLRLLPSALRWCGRFGALLALGSTLLPFSAMGFSCFLVGLLAVYLALRVAGMVL